MVLAGERPAGVVGVEPDGAAAVSPSGTARYSSGEVVALRLGRRHRGAARTKVGPSTRAHLASGLAIPRWRLDRSCTALVPSERRIRVNADDR